MTDARPKRSRAWLPTKSLLAIVAALVAIFLIAGLTYQSLETRSVTARAVERTTELQHQLQQFLSLFKDGERGQRGYLLTNDPRYLDPYERARAAIPQRLARLRSALADNPEQRARIEAIVPVVDQKLEDLAEAIALARGGDQAAALLSMRTDVGRTTMIRLRESIEEMIAAEQRTLDAQEQAWEDSVEWSSYVVFGGSGMLLCMILFVGYLASRDYRTIEADAWGRRVQLALGTELQGDHDLPSIGDKVLRVLADQLDARVGAMYSVEGATLTRIAKHALDPTHAASKTLAVGDGLIGQAARDNRMLHITDVPEEHLRVRSAVGASRTRQLVVMPASADGILQAVVELGFFHALDRHELEVLQRVGELVAVSIRAARDRSRLEELLERTRQQAEELQAQQEELRVTNEELEQQSKSLQVSQTQLENQQAELEQINSELEAQTRSLERQRDELARASAELQRANEYKSQFLANMSHELRTPLNSTLILAKLLSDNRDGNLNDEQVNFAHTIYSAGNDLLTLINDILDLSKIEAGMLDVRPEPVVISRMLDELSKTFQPIAAQKRLGLEVKIAGGVPESFVTDPTRLQQILRNLVSNAFKFTEQGGVFIEVGMRDEQLAFAVRDTGIGIAPDQQELIFEPFRQADGGTTRKFGGTGLGLSISRDLARLLGGDLAVDSAVGRGSTFTLLLPREAPALPEQPRRRSSPSSAPPVRFDAPLPAHELPPVTAQPPNTTQRIVRLAQAPFPDDRDRVQGTSRTLLVIEDDPAFARVLYDLAHELEFLCIVATTGEEGIALAKHYAPSAIVLDVGLPDRSGLAVLDELKRNARTRHVPVHVVSGSDYTRAALEMGAAGYALKPVERDQLVDAIKRLEAKFTQKLRRVLIVEDDPLLRESTARLLTGRDVETVSVGTVAEALEQLRSTTFDCMVLDLSLPDRSGLELLEEVSRGDQYGFPPVIVYTGRTLSNDQVHALEKFSRSIIIKGARSPERLLDEVTLFLHQVESELPPDRQRMLRDARDREAVFEGRRILLVEDDVRNVFALSAVLEPKGAQVAIARNGREAVEHVRSHPVDLVLMDIMMPEMDGLEAMREIRKDPRLTKLPIIALTAKAMIDDREKCIEAGANDYIAKPLDVDKLLSLSRVWIRK